MHTRAHTHTRARARARTHSHTPTHPPTDHYKYELTEDFSDRRAGKTRRQFGHQADEDELGLSDESAGLSLPSDLESALIRPSNENSATGKLL